MKKTAMILVVVLVLSMLAGCFTTVHKVGKGAQAGTKMEATQWYAIWGLVPIGNVVDSQAMAGGTADYDIQTQFSFLDMLISGFTSAVTIQRQTVTVTK